jgi:HAD superfamily hydrolase (TIGR01484 family)
MEVNMKILGSDYDGTLNHGGITDEKIGRVTKWQERGNKFGIITGRGADHREYLLRKFPNFKIDFLAACNGGYIVNESGEVIFDSRCDCVPVQMLASDLFEWGCDEVYVEWTRASIIWPEHDSDITSNEEYNFYNLETSSSIDYFNQASIQMSTDEKAAELVEKITEKYSQHLTALRNGLSIDIVPVGVNKASGMYQVMKYFGASYEDVRTVGDNINDLDMLREFRSYAMKSGVKAALEAADGAVDDITEIFEIEG